MSNYLHNYDIKTDFLQFLHCPKSLWLLRRKPTLYQHGAFSDYLQKIVSEGYEVELYLKSLFSSQIDSDKYSYQTGFKTGDGLYAIADCTRLSLNGSEKTQKPAVDLIGPVSFVPSFVTI